MIPATRENALRRMPRRFTEVYVPEQGLTYRLKSLNELERQQYVAACESADERGHDRSRELLIVACAIDAQGERLFEDADVETLAGDCLDSAVTTRLYNACLEHCTFESGEDLAKNSRRIPIDSSP